MSDFSASDRILCALDTTDPDTAFELAEKLGSSVGG